MPALAPATAATILPPPSSPITAPAGKPTDLALNLISGSVGGAFQVMCGQPLDTIKTRAQTAPPGQFKGPWDVAVQTVRKEGFLGLYKGMASPLLGVAAVNSLLFGALSVAKRIVSPYPDLSIAQVGLAGGMAGGVNAILASPVEMFKIRMQGQYGSTTDKKLGAVVKEMWTQHGFRRGIMRGFWVTFIREIPAYAAFYSMYEFSKRKFSSIYTPPPGQQLPVWCLLTSGASGGVAYWLASYPLDIVKSNVQLSATPPERGYILRELKSIVHKNGWAGLLRGLSPTLIRAVPAAASTFVAFEITRDLLIEHAGF